MHPLASCGVRTPAPSVPDPVAGPWEETTITSVLSSSEEAKGLGEDSPLTTSLMLDVLPLRTDSTSMMLSSTALTGSGDGEDVSFWVEATSTCTGAPVMVENTSTLVDIMVVMIREVKGTLHPFYREKMRV